jgi:hypothetical protein
MWKHNILIFLLLMFSASLPFVARAENEASERGDSIMRLVINNAIKYQNILKAYEAEIYIKGRMKIHKRNYLMRFAHNLFPVNRREADMVFEMINISRFEAPNNFFHDYKAINGSSIPNRQKQMEILRFLDLNIYSSTAFDGAILMPTNKHASRYYVYTLDSIFRQGRKNIYCVSFEPRHLSQKLISGSMFIGDSTWTISRIILSGRYYFSDFNIEMTFGEDFEHFNLPSTVDLTLRYSMLGNEVESSYHSSYNYLSVSRGWDQLYLNTSSRVSYDLTPYFGASSDSVLITSDSLFWRQHRDRILTSEEEDLYAESVRKKNEVLRDTSVAAPNIYLKFAELIVNDINAGYKNTYIRYYGILNPSELGYSESNGITLRQRMRIRKIYDNNTQLTFIPDAGFATRRKEVFLKGTGIWDYLPSKMASLNFTVGNGNQSYSAGLMNEISAQIADSSFTVDDLNLQYFHHYYGELANRIELFNGFLLSTNLTYNLRKPVRRRFNIPLGDNIKEIVNSDYNDLTATIGISYTPHTFYRINKQWKQYLYSYYPTFSIEIAKSFPGVWKSVGNYMKMETDIHQSISVGLLQKINYHISAGLYLFKQTSYFTDFRYFARRNFPDTWDDRIGGVFNLLDRKWFYASDEYAQVHLMYETPFLMLALFKNSVPKYIFAERLYLSQLWTPALPSYTEIGYGIGNHIFDIAVFASFSRSNYQAIGVKFAFEIFR